MLVNIQSLINAAKCYEAMRAIRWPEGVRCTGVQQPLEQKTGIRKWADGITMYIHGEIVEESIKYSAQFKSQFTVEARCSL